MTTSRIFELTDFAAAALSRHEAQLESASKEQRKRARELFLEHGEGLFLSMLLEDERAANNRRNQLEHEQALRAAKIAARFKAWHEAKTSTLEGLAQFFCDCVGASVTSCDHLGNVGTKPAHRVAAEAASDLRNQGSGKFFAVSLPPGVVAIRCAPEVFEQLKTNWPLPSSCSWEIAGQVYAIYGGETSRNVITGNVSFLKTIRCGTSASWIVEPGATLLDSNAELPSLPSDLQDAVANCAPGSEKLLERFLV
jgi:hypothetical protein